MINITLKDGNKKQIEQGKTCLELAKEISEGLARNMTAALIGRKSKRPKTQTKPRRRSRNTNI